MVLLYGGFPSILVAIILFSLFVIFLNIRGIKPSEKEKGKLIAVLQKFSNNIYFYNSRAYWQYDKQGNLIREEKNSTDNKGWWRLKAEQVLWDPNALEPD